MLEASDPAVVGAALRYRHVNQAEPYVEVEMEAVEGGFAAAIPADYAEADYALQYHVVVRADDGRAWLHPGLGPELSEQPYHVVRPDRCPTCAREPENVTMLARARGPTQGAAPVERAVAIAPGNAPEDADVGTVVAIGTLDTKGAEYAFLRDRLIEHGADVILVDAGVQGEPTIEADVSRQEVARAAGADVEELAAAGDRGAAVETMSRGAAAIVERLYQEGRLDGVVGMGGTGGTSLVTHAMQRLPVGVPKLMVSTVGSGDTRPYVGAVDIAMMYSVVDIAGVNQISARIIGNAAAAIAGMASASIPEPGDARPLIGASMFGVTTPCVTTARERLEELGYEVLVFHQTGTGGQSMEELVRAGFIVGRARRHDDRALRRARRRRPRRAPAATRGGGRDGGSAGGLARRPRHGELRSDGHGARALPLAEPLRPQPERDPDADDARGMRRARPAGRSQAQLRDRPDGAVRAVAGGLDDRDRGAAVPRRGGR